MFSRSIHYRFARRRGRRTRGRAARPWRGFERLEPRLLLSAEPDPLALGALGTDVAIAADTDSDFAAENGVEPAVIPKWEQRPVPVGPDNTYQGWDEFSVYGIQQIVADDWLCEGPAPVTDIQWWGSFLGWDLPDDPPMPDAFRLGIWTDVPAGFDQPFSHPGQMVWEWLVRDPDWQFAGWEVDPRDASAPREAMFQFDTELPQSAWYWQGPDDGVHWISIAAEYIDPDVVAYPFGWTTRLRDPNSGAPDDAVRIHAPLDPVVNSRYVEGEPIFWPDPDTSWDTAFVLGTRPQLDFGDAPDGMGVPGYPTLLLSGGARHASGGPWLGDAAGQPDVDVDGQPHPDALGDDMLDGNDDEDGVIMPALVPGATAHLTVDVVGDGVLDAWIDFDQDRVWDDATERIHGTLLSHGTHVIAVDVPDWAVPGATFARFRISTNGRLSPGGPAPDGEVEDHRVFIHGVPSEAKWVQWPDLTPNGIDIRVDRSGSEMRWLADDFECDFTSLLTDVHLWGSWLRDVTGRIQRINLSIHSDDPVGPGGSDPENRYSQPDELLWSLAVGPDAISVSPYETVPDPGEYWWDPATNQLIPGADAQVWRVDIDIDPERAFIQHGTEDEPLIYWLQVGVETDGQSAFGWKTRDWPAHFMDDAVWDAGSELPRIWKELRYPQGHPYHGLEKDSVDMAFALTWKEVQYEHDLGDAPDSTNGHNVPMTAYPGTPAHFPTVYQAGSPAHGPIHWEPEALAYLGDAVSLENEADSGADADGVNNIVPALDLADLDGADDGVVLPPTLTHCAWNTLDYVVTVVDPIYRSMSLNVWFDFNRDGDFDDIISCPGGLLIPEWAVQDEQVQIGAPGTYDLTTSEFLAWHPSNSADPEALWMRVTLAERSAPDPAGMVGGGGAGPVEGYQYGETEDYLLQDYVQAPLDYGDAPEGVLVPGYPTLLLSNGARHVLGGPWLGDNTDNPDAEIDGQPDPNAQGDDVLDGNDDEDGVALSMLAQGLTGQVRVLVSGGGYLDAWIDFNGNRVWEDAERIHGALLGAGTHTFNVSVPHDAAVGQTFGRFRISRQGGLGPTGLSNNGEVEDVAVRILPAPEHDLGDAPDSSNTHGVAMAAYPGTPAQFPTVYQAGSPAHGPIHWDALGVAYLGDGVSLEYEADAGPDQDGVNNLDPPGDAADRDGLDDGVHFPLTLTHCGWNTLDYDVTVLSPLPAPLYTNVWFDFNRDGDWDDLITCADGTVVSEWAVQNDAVVVAAPGTSTQTTTPFVAWHPVSGGAQDPLWMRITLAEQPVDPSGAAPSGGAGPADGYEYGETEDYLVEAYGQEPLDYGDAPEVAGTMGYPTRLLSDGARHILGGPWLGVDGDRPDAEIDGQPDPNALGDDLLDGNDDEDGVSVSPLVQGLTGQATVKVNGGGGVLDAWIDFNGNRTWEAGERIYGGPLGGGSHTFNVLVPGDAVVGQTFGRFRISGQGGLAPTGLARDGEVEDVEVRIRAAPEHDLGDAPDSSNSHGLPMSAYPGAVAIPARFPTVYQIGSPAHGPIHWAPLRAAYLGDGVSLEDEADVGADQDGMNNIDPPNDAADQDRLDDGVHFPLTLTHCGWNTLDYDVTVATPLPVPLYTNVWFDFNRDGDWDDVITCADGTVVSEWAVVNDTVPAVAAGTFTRTTSPFVAWHPVSSEPYDPLWMRITLAERPVDASGVEESGGAGPAEGYDYGETEDYLVDRYLQEPLDYGDAPEAAGALGYATTLLSNGARHTIGGPWLGDDTDHPDAEIDGQPHPWAQGDDTLDGNDDEDGVSVSALLQGQIGEVTVQVSGGDGVLDAWIDFNGNRVWEAAEQIYGGLLAAGTSTFNVTVPNDAKVGQTFGRFRISSQGGLAPTGPARDGEVEDVLVRIMPGPVHDLGDAPDGSNSHGAPMTAYPGTVATPARFPTVYQAGSPAHGPIHLDPLAVAYLGEGVTLEHEADTGPDQDGVNNLVPPIDAADLDGRDDGVHLPLTLAECDLNTLDYDVMVVNPLPIELYVNVWFDFNRDGDWNDVLRCPDGAAAPEWAVQNDSVVPFAPGLLTQTSSPFRAWHPDFEIPGDTNGDGFVGADDLAVVLLKWNQFVPIGDVSQGDFSNDGYVGADDLSILIINWNKMAPSRSLWMRITLSEQPWDDVGGVLGAGGAGPAAGYRLGETEDYLIKQWKDDPQQAAVASATGAVDLPAGAAATDAAGGARRGLLSLFRSEGRRAGPRPGIVSPLRTPGPDAGRVLWRRGHERQSFVDLISEAVPAVNAS